MEKRKAAATTQQSLREAMILQEAGFNYFDPSKKKIVAVRKFEEVPGLVSAKVTDMGNTLTIYLPGANSTWTPKELLMNFSTGILCAWQIEQCSKEEIAESTSISIDKNSNGLVVKALRNKRPQDSDYALIEKAVLALLENPNAKVSTAPAAKPTQKVELFWKCPNCGTRNLGTAKFCPECGAVKPAATTAAAEADTATADPAPAEDTAANPAPAEETAANPAPAADPAPADNPAPVDDPAPADNPAPAEDPAEDPDPAEAEPIETAPAPVPDANTIAKGVLSGQISPTQAAAFTVPKIRRISKYAGCSESDGTGNA